MWLVAAIVGLIAVLGVLKLLTVAIASLGRDEDLPEEINGQIRMERRGERRVTEQD